MHDDLAQRVALLQFEIEGMKQNFAALPSVQNGLDSLRGSVSLLAQDLHRICERLHPAVLEQLGLVRGVTALCEDQEKVSGMKVQFAHSGIPEVLPPDVSLCLYRAVQEALQNSAKHSGAVQASVTLKGDRDGVRAVIRDFGRGFDMKSQESAGLGLKFLMERVKLLNGRWSVVSSPGKGTRISIWVSHRSLSK